MTLSQTPQNQPGIEVANDTSPSLLSRFPKSRTVLASTLIASLMVTSTPKKAEACELICIGLIAFIGGVLVAASSDDNEPEKKPKPQPAQKQRPKELQWLLSDKKREIRNGRPEIIHVPKDVPVQIGNEVSTSREIGFSKSDGGASSGSVNLLAISGQLQDTWDSSVEAKLEQNNNRVLNLTLNWDVCDTWLIDYFKTVRDGVVTAPQYGAKTPLPFTVTTGQRMEPHKLCADGTNIATPETIAAAQSQIDALVIEQ